MNDRQRLDRLEQHAPGGVLTLWDVPNAGRPQTLGFYGTTLREAIDTRWPGCGAKVTGPAGICGQDGDLCLTCTPAPSGAIARLLLSIDAAMGADYAPIRVPATLLTRCTDELLDTPSSEMIEKLKQLAALSGREFRECALEAQLTVIQLLRQLGAS